jgi:hypothetical protein
MNAEAFSPQFTIWGFDHSPYGPVELPMLVNWIKDERVTADTWVFETRDEAWHRAADMPELKVFFGQKSGAPALESASPSALRPGVLRRVKILATLTDAQLERFASFMEVQKARQWSVIVKQGEHGDSMFFILEGEVRVRMMVGEKETILATLTIGEFFGDVALLDHGPRSADVVANTDATLLKVSANGFQKLAKEAPELATPLLMSLSRTLTARIRADNKRHSDSVKFARAAS